MEVAAVVIPSALFAVVLTAVGCASLSRALFFGAHGRGHRLLGLFHLILLILCFGDAILCLLGPGSLFLLHGVLGISGTLLAASAAYAFRHEHVKNPASGTLDEHTLVTNSEMTEHVFYQGLNLAQVAFLHCVDGLPRGAARLGGALAVQAVWLARGYFPVNRFSDNYKQHDPHSSAFIRSLYRMKKWQYVFLKHALLFGLDVGVAASAMDGWAQSRGFRLYWLLLNASFVLEFFLQTLVRRGRLSHADMLRLQLVLMSAASIAVIPVLYSVHFAAAAASLALNFAHRKHDFANSCAVIAALVAWPHVTAALSSGL
jgi:hypothetical protein